nr:MAG TPA: hypothetical protein [Caudoviricetes sp.]
MWPSCEKCGRLCVRFDDKLCVLHKADRGDYIRSRRGTRRKKAKRVEPENVKPVFPWSTRDGYFNGDMFEDWLNLELDPNDPYRKLQRMIKARETAIYSQFVDEATRILKKSVLDRGRVQ